MSTQFDGSSQAKWRKVMRIGKRSNWVVAALRGGVWEGGSSGGIWEEVGGGGIWGENHQVSTCPLPDGSIKGRRKEDI